MDTKVKHNKYNDIDGVVIEPLWQSADDRGRVMHMLKSTSPLYERFGEVYFSIINYGAIKAWKRHFKMTQHFAVPVGEVRLVVYDDRDGSPTKGNVKVIEFGNDNYSIVKIPPLLWYGFKGICKEPSLIANCTDLPHDPEEQEIAAINDHSFTYKW